ncbi:hypothetical protein FB45DRAFT_1085127 [Roridomyces roridus]|uniref:MYND-type domain-containing protein n=1 Tax=Roridomyces roridus TaxID=1738132 RepID=A0AAD7FLW0_9AGAR|nr:hypothetical protein FB45DRAFT_1085127 [Roridomyces roridus]
MTTIHPAFLPRNISRLPLSLQRFARLAKSQGSWKGETASTPIHYQFSSTVPEETLGLLPVIYSHLDPSLIPSFDDDLSTVLNSMASAMRDWAYLERALRSPRFPLAATMELWPRVWAWMEWVCICTYDFNLVNAPQVAASFLRPAFEVVIKFSGHTPTQLAMTSNPGLHRVIAVAWARQVEDFDAKGDVDTQFGNIAAALRAFSTVQTSDGHGFSEILDGCGGRNPFCLTLTRTLDLATRYSTFPGSRVSTTVAGAHFLLEHIHTVSSDTLPYILSHGLIPALVSALGVVGSPSDEPIPWAVWSLPNLLRVGLVYPWVEQALQAGLLNQVISWGSKRGTNVEHVENFPKLLEDVLPQTLVHPSSILEMKKGFASVELPSSNREFARSAFYAPWNKLKVLSDERSRVLEVWEAEGRPSFMVCYNLECGKVSTNRDGFRRCSDCRTAAYCSEACQRADWPVGHRKECRFHPEARLELAQIGFHHNGRAFLRNLLRMDYLRLRVPIAEEMVRFMSENPDTPLIVEFDYTHGTAQFGVLPLSNLDPKILSPYSQRLARAAGRLVAHTIRFGCGSHTFHALWPLYASTSEFLDGLKEIASTAKGAEDAELEPRVVEFIEKTDGNGVEEIHYC